MKWSARYSFIRPTADVVLCFLSFCVTCTYLYIKFHFQRTGSSSIIVSYYITVSGQRHCLSVWWNLCCVRLKTWIKWEEKFVTSFSLVEKTFWLFLICEKMFTGYKYISRISRSLNVTDNNISKAQQNPFRHKDSVFLFSLSRLLM